MQCRLTVWHGVQVLWCVLLLLQGVKALPNLRGAWQHMSSFKNCASEDFSMTASGLQSPANAVGWQHTSHQKPAHLQGSRKRLLTFQGTQSGCGRLNLVGSGVLDAHGHSKRAVVVLAIDVVQVRRRVAQDAVAHTAVVPCLYHKSGRTHTMPRQVLPCGSNKLGKKLPTQFGCSIRSTRRAIWG
jgi:hypothetical protein